MASALAAASTAIIERARGARCRVNNPVPHGQLEHRAGDVELVHGGLEPSGLFEPPRVPVGPQVVDAAAVPNVVVLGRAVLVIPMLLVQDLLDLWFHASAPSDPSQRARRPTGAQPSEARGGRTPDGERRAQATRSARHRLGDAPWLRLKARLKDSSDP